MTAKDEKILKELWAINPTYNDGNHNFESTRNVIRNIISCGMVTTDKYLGENIYHPVCISNNAITLANGVQIVLRFVGEPDVIHTNYDYIHCTCYWRPKNNELVLPQPALQSIVTKELIYSGSKFPIASLFRMRKYIERGWTINAGQIVKIAFQINELDLKDPIVLKQQLIGVDMVLFMELFERLAKEDNPDTSRIVEIIDEIFAN